MPDKDNSDEELEKEFEEAYKASEKRKDIFSILRKEKEAKELKEKRVKDKFEY